MCDVKVPSEHILVFYSIEKIIIPSSWHEIDIKTNCKKCVEGVVFAINLVKID
jgi:hypothetical protein